MSHRHELPPSAPDNTATPWASVDNSPALPIAVHTCVETWNPERIGALALYCSDGRWGQAFDEFCHKRLLIPRYDRWAVPGGPAWLVSRAESGDLYHAIRTQLEFLVRVHELERIVLITHYGCAFYHHLLGKTADDCLAAQTADLHTARNTLRDWFAHIRVETYLAMQKGRCMSFHEMA